MKTVDSFSSICSYLVMNFAGGLVDGNFTQSFQQMQEAQWLTPHELRQRMDAKLEVLLRHAAEHVPFYRDFYKDAQLKSNGLRTSDDLLSLPIITKADFRRLGVERFVAQNIPRHRRLEWTTSGSTGEPFRFYLDREGMPLVFASHLFYDSWFRLKPFDRYIRVMTPPISTPPLPEDAPFIARVRQAIRSKLQQSYENITQQRISIWEIDAAKAEELYQRIERFRPAYILGYTSSLASIADLLLRKQLPLRQPMKAVVTIAETLTPSRRRLIEEYFRGPIINRYGQREFKYWAAQSCYVSPERFHVNTELVVPEVVRADGSLAATGEVGRLVMTNLSNFAMPFIRYDTGDLAVLGWRRCICGRGFPQIEHLEGRSREYLTTASAGVIHPVVLGQYLFVTHNYIDAIRHFQAIQESREKVKLLIVPGEAFNEDIRNALSQHLQQLLGPGIAVTIETVAEIPPEKSGKRPIIKRPASRALSSI